MHRHAVLRPQIDFSCGYMKEYLIDTFIALVHRITPPNKHVIRSNTTRILRSDDGYAPVTAGIGSPMECTYSRVILRCGARIRYGETSRRRRCVANVSVELSDPAGTLTFTVLPLTLTRPHYDPDTLMHLLPSQPLVHPGLSWERVCDVIGEVLSFDDVARLGVTRHGDKPASDIIDVCYQLLAHLRLENTRRGLVAAFPGDVAEEDKRPFGDIAAEARRERTAAVNIQRIARGILAVHR